MLYSLGGGESGAAGGKFKPKKSRRRGGPPLNRGQRRGENDFSTRASRTFKTEVATTEYSKSKGKNFRRGGTFIRVSFSGERSERGKYGAAQIKRGHCRSEILRELLEENVGGGKVRGSRNLAIHRWRNF